MPSPTELTPQERLAISRMAILKHMNRHHREFEDRTDDELGSSDPSRPASHGTLGIIKQAAKVWWHRNPASTVVELAQPLLSGYASVHPFKLLAISAGIGAATVVIRPWRMVSVGALLVGAVKSSGMTNALASMITSVTHRPDNTNTTP